MSTVLAAKPLAPPQSSSDRQRGHRWRHALPPVRYHGFRQSEASDSKNGTQVCDFSDFFLHTVDRTDYGTGNSLYVQTYNKDFMEKYIIMAEGALTL